MGKECRIENEVTEVKFDMHGNEKQRELESVRRLLHEGGYTTNKLGYLTCYVAEGCTFLAKIFVILDKVFHVFWAM